MDKKKTFWPYGILLSLFTIVLACVATIIFASGYPVYEDDSFFLSYQEVENNYDQIELKQKKFFENFALILDDSKINFEEKMIDEKRSKKAYVLKDDNITLLLVKQPEGKIELKDIHLSAKLTRPHTSENDMFLQEKNVSIKLSNNEAKAKAYLFSLPTLAKGRWQLKIKAENKDILGFKSFEFFVQ
ncbi:FixH family protein [Campylobacter upsaliensis]|uniref:FixH family protein n=1 Tax=Campylobacter upsaliensis TaxID=28080 RepID=UPI00214A438A|nr:FixH family protein [Campylobacter upsaliensis]MCR2098308.1 FixH family protein [Campylobacter upsaliensis]